MLSQYLELLIRHANRHDEQPAIGELIEQLGGHGRRGRSANDAVEGRVLGPAVISIARANADVSVAHALQRVTRAIGKLRDQLD